MHGSTAQTVSRELMQEKAKDWQPQQVLGKRFAPEEDEDSLSYLDGYPRKQARGSHQLPSSTRLLFGCAEALIRIKDEELGTQKGAAAEKEAALQSEVSALRSQAESTREDLERAREAINARDEQIASLKADLQATFKDGENQIGNLSVNVQAIAQERDDEKTKRAMVMQEGKKLEVALSESQDRETNLQQTVAQLQRQLQDANEREKATRETAEAEFAKLRTEFETSWKEHEAKIKAACDERIQCLKGIMSEWEEEACDKIESLRETVEALKEERVELKAEKEEIEQENADLIKDRNEVQDLACLLMDERQAAEEEEERWEAELFVTKAELRHERMKNQQRRNREQERQRKKEEAIKRKFINGDNMTDEEKSQALLMCSAKASKKRITSKPSKAAKKEAQKARAESSTGGLGAKSGGVLSGRIGKSASKMNFSGLSERKGKGTVKISGPVTEQDISALENGTQTMNLEQVDEPSQ